jgi:hypothetical protein
VLQVDAYTGYAALAAPSRAGGAITLAFCLAHARRRFFDEYKRSACAVSEAALRRLGEIYDIEARIRRSSADNRAAVRQAVFLTDGRVEVDNNIVERTIRPIALGRRNALFAGSAAKAGPAWLR